MQLNWFEVYVKTYDQAFESSIAHYDLFLFSLNVNLAS